MKPTLFIYRKHVLSVLGTCLSVALLFSCGSGTAVNLATDTTFGTSTFAWEDNANKQDSVNAWITRCGSACTSAAVSSSGNSSSSSGESAVSSSSGTPSSSNSISSSSLVATSSTTISSSTTPSSSSTAASSSAKASSSSIAVSSSSKASSSSVAVSSSSVAMSSSVLASSSTVASSSSTATSSSGGTSGSIDYNKNVAVTLPAGLGPFTLNSIGTWSNANYDLIVYISGSGNNASISYSVSVDGGTATTKTGTYTAPNGPSIGIPKTAKTLVLTILSATDGSGTTLTNPTVTIKTNGN